MFCTVTSERCWGREELHLLHPDPYALVPRKVTLHLGLSLSPYPVGLVTHLLAKFIIQSEIPKDIVMKNFWPAFFPWAHYKLP